MKLPTSNKTSSYKKALIKKGYYPGKLLKVEPFTDKDGVLKEGKYGHQLIMEFAVFKADPENGVPVAPMMFEEEPVKVSKFVYYEYKSKTGEFQTAITPNSAITKLLINMGWTFSTEDVDLEKFVGSWVELNIDDYTPKGSEDGEKASTIANINKYDGPPVPKDLESVDASKKSEAVKKTVKHNDVKESEDVDTGTEAERIKKKIAELEKMNQDGFLTDEGLAQAKEQQEARLKELE